MGKKYAKKQGKSNNIKRGGPCLAKTKKNNAGIIYVATKRIERGGKQTMQDLKMVLKHHGLSVCTKREQATTAVQGGSKNHNHALVILL